MHACERLGELRGENRKSRGRCARGKEGWKEGERDVELKLALRRSHESFQAGRLVRDGGDRGVRNCGRWMGDLNCALGG